MTGNTNTCASAAGEAALVSGFGCIGDWLITSGSNEIAEWTAPKHEPKKFA